MRKLLHSHDETEKVYFTIDEVADAIEQRFRNVFKDKNLVDIGFVQMDDEEDWELYVVLATEES